MPQPSVHTVTQYGFQTTYHSPPGPGGMTGNGQVPPSAQVPMSFHDQAELARKMRDYEALTQIITQWNANRLDLFALSLPNEVKNLFYLTLIIIITTLSPNPNHCHH